MQASAMKACFQIAECSLSYAKIRNIMMQTTIAITEIVTTFTELFSRVCNIFYAQAFSSLWLKHYLCSDL
jgi:hypothetical protein